MKLLMPLLFLAVGLAAAPAANADQVTDYIVVAAPAVCETLDNHPTIAGVTGVMIGISGETGWTDGETVGRIMVTSVLGWCPQHTQLLQQFTKTRTT